MRTKDAISQLVQSQNALGAVVDQSEITQAVNECMYHIRRSLNPNEAASMFYGVFSCTNPELCCAFMERLKHEHHASWVTVCENFKTEALDTYA